MGLIYDEIKGRQAYQQVQISALDAKANFGLGSATLLTAAITTLHNAAEPALAADVLTVVALLIYVLVLVFSFCAYRLRFWSVSPNPRQVLDDAVHWPEEETRARLAKQRAVDFERNEREIGIKAIWVRWALLALMAEGVALLLISIVRINT